MKMNRLVLLGALLTVSMGAVAQSWAPSIEVVGQRVASDIVRFGRSLGPNDRAEVSRHLDAISRILGGQGQGGGGFTQGPEYTCVSRDNDGANPYVIGIKDRIQVTRIKNAQFSSQGECQSTLQSIRSVGYNSMLCLSRDNDGSNPYLLSVLNGSNVTRIVKTVVQSKAECDGLLQNLQPRQNAATFCTSRDNDGAAPYVAASLDLSTLTLQLGTESFQTKSVCQQFIDN